jgi:hypothetical protein
MSFGLPFDLLGNLQDPVFADAFLAPGIGEQALGKDGYKDASDYFNKDTKTVDTQPDTGSAPLKPDPDHSLLHADMKKVLDRADKIETVIDQISEHAETLMDFADVASSVATLGIAIANTISVVLGHPMDEALRVGSQLANIICNYYDVGACTTLAAKQRLQKEMVHAIANFVLASVLLSGMSLYVIDNFTHIQTGLLTSSGASIFVSVGGALTMLVKWIHESYEIDKANSFIAEAEDEIKNIKAQIAVQEDIMNPTPLKETNFIKEHQKVAREKKATATAEIHRLKKEKQRYLKYIDWKKGEIETRTKASKVWKWCFFAMTAMAILGIVVATSGAALIPLHMLQIVSASISCSSTLYRIYTNRKLQYGRVLPTADSIKGSFKKFYRSLPSMSIFSSAPKSPERPMPEQFSPDSLLLQLQFH